MEEVRSFCVQMVSYSGMPPTSEMLIFIKIEIVQKELIQA